jgi:tyrosyl-tRNA synthetase
MKSKGEVKRAIAEGGVYINNHRVTDVNTSIRKDQFIEGKYLVLRRGKKNYFLLKTEQE